MQSPRLDLGLRLIGSPLSSNEMLLGHGLRSGAANCGRLIHHNATRMI